MQVYNGITHGITRVLADEGVRGFWRGLAPAIMLIAPQTAIMFTTYEALKRLTTPSDGDEEASMRFSLLTPFSGAIAGCLSKTTVYPLEVVKKRFQIVGFEEARSHFGRLPSVVTTSAMAANSNNNGSTVIVKRTGLATISSVFRIVRDEGARALFKGWGPAMLKAGVSTGLTFTFFEFYKSLLMRCNF